MNLWCRTLTFQETQQKRPMERSVLRKIEIHGDLDSFRGLQTAARLMLTWGPYSNWAWWYLLPKTRGMELLLDIDCDIMIAYRNAEIILLHSGKLSCCFSSKESWLLFLSTHFNTIFLLVPSFLVHATVRGRLRPVSHSMPWRFTDGTSPHWNGNASSLGRAVEQWRVTA